MWGMGEYVICNGHKLVATNMNANCPSHQQIVDDITTIKTKILQKKSTSLASFSAHDARLPLHPYNQRCKKIMFYKTA